VNGCALKHTALALAALIGTAAASIAHAEDWHTLVSAPRPQFTQMPFWFWNDELKDDEILRQMADFRAHGVYGFVIHPRLGLPKTIPYMGKEWLHFVRVAVEEAARTNMRVCLYDEAMYPSGSAHGEVVRANAAFAAQALVMSERTFEGPGQVDISEAGGPAWIATVAARRGPKGSVDFDSFRSLPASEKTLTLPAGSWLVMTFRQVPSGGHIRGVHPGEDDTQPDAPAAADLLNPKAVQEFLARAYEPYHAAMKEYYGKTIIGMFTDEPDMLGRGARRGAQPWTTGLADEFVKGRGYDLRPMLPALFHDAGERGAKVRADFRRVLAARLDQSYYSQLSTWCEKHGIALIGHPAASDDTGPLRRFHIPGQDMVWRWVVPGNSSGVEGVNSTVAKCSSSVARHDGRRRNADELYGAYGWQLTMEEMKWLADWMLVRGVNLFCPHAFYYSLRGERVAERPPDVGPHNTWWPQYRQFADYTSRMSALLVDGRQQCTVAVLGVDGHLPWRAAKWLFQHQVDFNYLEDWRLCEQVQIGDGRLQVADMSYAALVIDTDEPLGDQIAKRAQAFELGGGKVYRWAGDASLVALNAAASLKAIPAAPDLRCMRLHGYSKEFYLLTNEGESVIETALTCKPAGRAEWYDAWSNTFTPAAVVRDSGAAMSLHLRLGQRESRVLCVDPQQPAITAATAAASAPASAEAPADAQEIPLTAAWVVRTNDGRHVAGGLGDWTSRLSIPEFAGTVVYQTHFELSGAPSHCWLDLGVVGDWAVVRVNGVELPPRFWSPYQWEITRAVLAGKNELTVLVTNSLANEYAPKQGRPSGLFGPVHVKVQRAR
jgi:hypothetical protein